MKKEKVIALIIVFLILIIFILFKINHKLPNQNNLNPDTEKWFLPEDFNSQPAWGIKNGIIFSVWPADLGGIGGGKGGPRGLFRIHKHGDEGLGWVNFIAVGPITTDLKIGFSELEKSSVDGKSGKYFTPYSQEYLTKSEQMIELKLSNNFNDIAYFTYPEKGVEQLNVLFEIEKFDNGAHVYITASIRDDKPDEIEFTTYAHEDSVNLKLSAVGSTAGNFNHLRLLWLDEKVVDSRELYSDYTGFNFAPIKIFKYNELQKDSEGSIIVALTRNSDDVEDYFNNYFTKYKLTQYYKKYSGHYSSNAFATVNGRYVFWKTTTQVPGGIAYENFELDDEFYSGQKIWFGATEKTPVELGF